MVPNFNHRTPISQRLKMPTSIPKIGKPERETQERIIALIRDELGYRYL